MKIATGLGTLGQVIKIGVMHSFTYSNSGLFKLAIYILCHKKTMVTVL